MSRPAQTRTNGQQAGSFCACERPQYFEVNNSSMKNIPQNAFKCHLRGLFVSAIRHREEQEKAVPIGTALLHLCSGPEIITRMFPRSRNSIHTHIKATDPHPLPTVSSQRLPRVTTLRIILCPQNAFKCHLWRSLRSKTVFTAVPPFPPLSRA